MKKRCSCAQTTCHRLDGTSLRACARSGETSSLTLSSSALRDLEPRLHVQPIGPCEHDLELVEPPPASRRNTQRRLRPRPPDRGGRPRSAVTPTTRAARA